MRRGIKVLALALLMSALSVQAGPNIFVSEGIIANLTPDDTNLILLDPGNYIVEYWIPDPGVASDPCGVVGGNIDGATVTLKYTPDVGITFFDVEPTALVGAQPTTTVKANLEVARNYHHSLEVINVGAATCFSFSMRRSR